MVGAPTDLPLQRPLGPPFDHPDVAQAAATAAGAAIAVSVSVASVAIPGLLSSLAPWMARPLGVHEHLACRIPSLLIPEFALLAGLAYAYVHTRLNGRGAAIPILSIAYGVATAAQWRASHDMTSTTLGRLEVVRHFGTSEHGWILTTACAAAVLGGVAGITYRRRSVDQLQVLFSALEIVTLLSTSFLLLLLTAVAGADTHSAVMLIAGVVGHLRPRWINGPAFITVLTLVSLFAHIDSLHGPVVVPPIQVALAAIPEPLRPPAAVLLFAAPLGFFGLVRWNASRRPSSWIDLPAFRTFSTPDSRCNAAGVEIDGQRWFVKWSTDPIGMDALRRGIAAAAAVQHDALVPVHEATDTDSLVVVVQPFVDGEPIRECGDVFRAQPLSVRIRALMTVLDGHARLADHSILPVDLYDGNVLFDATTGAVHVVDLDEYRVGPFILDADRLPGSTRFMAPEEFERGARIDETTAVFVLGRMAMVLLGDHQGRADAWIGPPEALAIARRATEPAREARFSTVREFGTAMRRALALTECENP